MKHFLLSLIITPLTAFAGQSPFMAGNSPQTDEHQHGCKVVHIPEHELPKTKFHAIRPLGEPSFLAPSNYEPQIFDNGYEYVYRLAMCVSPYYVNKLWFGDREKAKEWMIETGKYLNEVYSRDFGIRFDVVIDDRLILSDYPQGYPEEKFEQPYGTEIINSLIGEKSYDCGILIRPKTLNFTGLASLGGAYARLHKASAMATFTPSTIAHELGHMFGAKHTHVKDDGVCVEPGTGQSIMSYGEPRTSFSLASVITVRRQLKNQLYFPNANRDSSEIVGGTPDPFGNIPYVVPSTKSKPKLNRKMIRKNYTVTKDTRFQFYIPVEEAKPEYTYGAQAYDEAIWGFKINALQPVYSLSKEPCTMFQPYYDQGKNEEGKYDAILVPHSDEYRTGRYTYLLAVADGARYDLEKVTLNIVDGKPFEMKTKIDLEMAHGKPLKLEWNPCTELYGTDSRVRILLSDDFGQTYKYVLDDQVPNTGKWEGYWPFVDIGRVYYRNFDKAIRGGVVKIEVIGEAAYTVSKEQPDMANPNLLGTGGFTLNNSYSYILFKNSPKPYLQVKSESEIPEMTELEAYHKKTPSKIIKAKGEEERKGNVIRRLWKVNNNGYTYAYSQLIVIDDPNKEERAEVFHKADEVKLLADDLYRHKGELGYPLPTLPVMQQLDAAYAEVFDANGKVQAGATVEKIAELRRVLDAICQIKDNEIVRPAHRNYYKLRNYQDMYGELSYYYLANKANPEDNNGFTTDASKAIVFRCTEDGDKHDFRDAQDKCMDLDPFLTPDSEVGIKLERGYTWGAFTMVNRIPACAQLSQGSKIFSQNTNYGIDPVGFRTNRNGTVSTDFQFIPVEFIEARKPEAERPWNILENKQLFTLEDNYSNLFVGKPVNIEKLQYKRQFNNTEWQTLYLPFDTDYRDWAGSCEIACINEVLLAEGHATATYVKLKEGKLSANQPYLIRAKTTGEHHFTFNNVTVKATEENRAQLAANGFDICMNGNYGQVSAENLKNNSGYTLQDNMLVKANGANGSLPSMRWYLSIVAESSSNVLPQSIELLEKGEAPVGTLSIETKEGYGTIYTDKSYVMPEGVTGYIVTEADAETKKLELVQAFGSGETVPAGTPLLVKGDKRTYMLYAPENGTGGNELPAENNLLLGTTTESVTTTPDGQSDEAFCFYKLYYGDADNSGIKRLGFYWGAQEGAAFTNQANKAYLAVSRNIADRIRGFALPGDNVTGIIPTVTPEKELVVYTITGIRLYPNKLSELKPGVYIVNGKKKIIK